MISVFCWHDFGVNFRRTKSHEPSLEIFRTNEEFLMQAALSQNTFYLVKSIIHNLYSISCIVHRFNAIFAD